MKARKTVARTRRKGSDPADGRTLNWAAPPPRARAARLSRERLIKKISDLRTKVFDLEAGAIKQREFEKVCQESEDRCRFLVDHSKEVILVLDKRGTILFANQHTVASYGYDRDELVGQPLSRFLEPQSAREAMLALSKDFSGANHGEYDVRALSKSGEVRHLRIARGSTPVHENGRLIGVMVTASDITELKRTATVLRASEQKFRNLAEQSPNMIFVNVRGRLVYVNQKCCEVMGYKKSEFYSPSFNFLDLIAPESVSSVRASFERHMKGKSSAPSEEILLAKDGKRIEAIVNTRLIDYGADSAILGTVTDISASKRAEEARQKSEEIFRAIFDNARDAYYLIDMAGNLVDANRTAETMTGFKVGDVVGKNILTVGLLPPEQIPRASSDLSLNLRGNSTGPEVYKMSRKDGSEFWAELSSHPITLTGRTLILGIARDITMSRRAEETLTKSEMKYRALFESANDAVFLMDLKEHTRMVNQKAAEMLGFGLPELLKMSYQDIVGPSDHQQAQSRIMEVMAASSQPLQERIFRKKDGAEIPVEINISLVRDESGRPLYIQRIVRDISARKKFITELQSSSKKLRVALEGVIKAVAATVEQRDPYTAGHQKRVAELARAIAAEMSLSTDQIEAVYMAGIIHDIGKISLPAEILSKPGALSDTEFALIKLHVKIGYEILKEIEFPWPITQIIYQHHERVDGSGYPEGLVGNAIRLEARILAVADVVEAMASHRPYRPARGLKTALLEISKGDGYDREVVAACVKLFTEKDYRL